MTSYRTSDLHLNSIYNSFAGAIQAGRYDYVSDYITAKNLGMLDGSYLVRTSAQLLWFPDSKVSTLTVLETVKKLKKRIASFPFLCAVGEAYPNAQHNNPIVALGSVYTHKIEEGSCDSVPCLSQWYENREMNLLPREKIWERFYRFLLIPIDTQESWKIS